MRLPDSRAAVLSLVTLMAACGGHHDRIAHADAPLPRSTVGPAADYPIVLGQPFTVDGVTYTPNDRLNYDQVGYAGIGSGEGVSIAHRTLPLPSYAEVTSLETGRTILVRVTERGPMTGSRLLDLSPAAATQLGAKPGVTPIRVRRVNPPEQERAMLRGGGQAPARMDTPKSLVAVLMRKLDPTAPAAPLTPAPQVGNAQPAKPVASAAPTPTVPAKPVKVAEKAPKLAAPAASHGTSVVQVGAFSGEAAAQKVAAKVGGKVSPSGKLFRVRTGPFASSAEAQAALAKARAAGYSDARIQHAD